MFLVPVSFTLLYRHLCVLHKPRGVCCCGFEMFDHREDVDNVFFSKDRPVTRVEHVLPQLHLNTEKKCPILAASQH